MKQHDQNPDRDPRAGAPFSPEELEHWRRRIAALPEVRIARIIRARRAIIDREYEGDRPIDAVVDALSADLADLPDTDDADLPEI